MKWFVCKTNVLWFAALPFILSSCVAQQSAFTQAETRARALVQQMNLNEKIEQLHGFRDKTHFRIVPGLKRLGSCRTLCYQWTCRSRPWRCWIAKESNCLARAHRIGSKLGYKTCVSVRKISWQGNNCFGLQPARSARHQYSPRAWRRAAAYLRVTEKIHCWLAK